MYNFVEFEFLIQTATRLYEVQSSREIFLEFSDWNFSGALTDEWTTDWAKEEYWIFEKIN
jgi:hypothetical protein